MKTRAAWLSMLVAAIALVALMAPIADAKTGKKKPHKPRKENSPLVIGHRGASGFLPEHTLQAYKLAINQGADYIEPDLVATKDGVLIARHEPYIGTTRTDDRDSTNVADHHEFDDRVDTRSVDGDVVTGWFASDFTLAEIKTLGAKQTRGLRPTQFDGQFKVPTLQEVIRLVKNRSHKLGRRIGIYPETKHPTYHAKELNPPLPLEGRLVSILKKNGLNSRRAPVFIQSFEQSNLKQLNTMTRVRLVQLMDAASTDDTTGLPTYDELFVRPYDWTVSGNPTLEGRTYNYFTTDEGLDEVKTYADGIGPWKPYIIPITGGGGGVPQDDTDLVERAHARGLLVHTWTFRNDSFPMGFPGGPIDEYLAFYREKVDGVFSDFPGTAVAARDIFKGL
jgi:glycerophosphoryl diester phosphodiesterase